uniref:RAB, member of RAS oncogene family like 2B n=1 Tax=Myotis myotis TaxID=51298 RepID=A0A7J7XI69_MYOMY|nr:hypothetical protein mMyoMyo1_011768 [Myotis myotis]
MEGRAQEIAPSPGLSPRPMARDKANPCAVDQEKYGADDNVKIICLGDSAVGKSKLMERFLMDGFQPQQLSTYAPTLYKHTATVGGKTILVDFWDTAGQERFQSMHASYYHKAHACIMQRGELFNDAIRLAVSYKQNPQDFMDEALQELENIDLGQKEEERPGQEQCGSTKSLPPS